MADGKPKGITDLLQGIGKTLIWIGIFAFAMYFYKCGAENGFSKFFGLPRVIGDYFSKGVLPGGGIPTVSTYRILVGSYNSSGAAIEVQKRLKNFRIDSSIIPQNGKYHVMVGNYITKKQAEGALNQVRSRGYPKAQLLSPPK